MHLEGLLLCLDYEVPGNRSFLGILRNIQENQYFHCLPCIFSVACIAFYHTQGAGQKSERKEEEGNSTYCYQQVAS